MNQPLTWQSLTPVLSPISVSSLSLHSLSLVSNSSVILLLSLPSQSVVSVSIHHSIYTILYTPFFSIQSPVSSCQFQSLVSVSSFCLKSLSQVFVSSLSFESLSLVSVSTLCLQSLSPVFVSSLCHQSLSPISVSRLHFQVSIFTLSVQSLSPDLVSSLRLQYFVR